METMYEAPAAAEPTLQVRERTDGLPSDLDPPQQQERDLALQIRMTASSLAGIALIQRDPDSEPAR